MHSDTPTDIEARAAQWLAQRDGTQWAAADAQALEAWLTDTRHRVAFLRLQASWQQAERLQALGAGWTQQGPPPRQHCAMRMNASVSAVRCCRVCCRYNRLNACAKNRRWRWNAVI